nr:glycosyltransferase [Plantibacter sp. CFBP 8798]
MQPALLAYGSVSPNKNLDVAVRAIAELKNADKVINLIVVGGGPRAQMTSEQITSLARDLGVERQVAILPAAPAEDIPALVRAAAVVLCLPSRFSIEIHTSGIPAEALAAGTPCVASPSAADFVSRVLLADRDERSSGLFKIPEPLEAGTVAGAIADALAHPAKEEGVWWADERRWEEFINEVAGVYCAATAVAHSPAPLAEARLGSYWSQASDSELVKRYWFWDVLTTSAQAALRRQLEDWGVQPAAPPRTVGKAASGVSQSNPEVKLLGEIAARWDPVVIDVANPRNFLRTTTSCVLLSNEVSFVDCSTSLLTALQSKYPESVRLCPDLSAPGDHSLAMVGPPGTPFVPVSEQGRRALDNLRLPGAIPPELHAETVRQLVGMGFLKEIR